MSSSTQTIVNRQWYDWITFMLPLKSPRRTGFSLKCCWVGVFYFTSWVGVILLSNNVRAHVLVNRTVHGFSKQEEVALAAFLNYYFKDMWLCIVVDEYLTLVFVLRSNRIIFTRPTFGCASLPCDWWRNICGKYAHSPSGRELDKKDWYRSLLLSVR